MRPNLLLLFLLLCCPLLVAQSLRIPVLIVGGGASGTTAAIQCGRMGVNATLIEEGPWLGGMLTSAGVSAIDGNHELPSGLWGEFRDSLYAHYGGPEAVSTGWVSHCLFEPAVGQEIFRNIIKSVPTAIDLRLNTRLVSLEQVNGRWRGRIQTGDQVPESFIADVLIDATELGDVAKRVGVPRDVGMDNRDISGEIWAPSEANDIIQDLTYVITLRDFGPESDQTIPRPSGYDPEEFRCACDTADPSTDGPPRIDCTKMLEYGRLPNGKFMINWPNCGNDYYLNLIDKAPEERDSLLREAKLHSLRFLYFMQTELGFTNLGIATDEYPSADGLPMIPYHRESGRIHGLVRLTVDHVIKPFAQQDPLYRTGIAVGDYPIDHHHKKRPDAPPIDFIRIKAPAYNLPLGSLIPKGYDNLIIAEKSISVSNIVNGATRLQPVVLQIGQAAGTLAALSIEEGLPPASIPVRAVQSALLNAKAYLMPYMDVPAQHPHWAAIQRIGATGILRGTGIPYRWANQSWFYPDRPISEWEFVEGLRTYYPSLSERWDASGAALQPTYLGDILDALGVEEALAASYVATGLGSELPEDHHFTRGEVAVLLDHLLHPFDLPIRHTGQLLRE